MTPPRGGAAAPRLLPPVAPAALAVVAAAALLVALPLGSLVLTALQGQVSEAFGHLAATVLPDALGQTLLLLLGVAAVTATVGVGAAWLITAYRVPGASWLAFALALPLAMPAYITAYIYVEILDAAGPVQSLVRAQLGPGAWRTLGLPEIRSLPGGVFVMSCVVYPYVYVAARAVFLTGCGASFDAARTLGAGGFRLFAAVGWPLARLGLAVGLPLALMEVLNDVGASEYLGVRTLTLTVYDTWLNRGGLPDAAGIACLTVAAVAGLLALQRRAGRGAAEQVRAPIHPVPLGRAAGLAAAGLLLVPVLAGFAVPAGFLAVEVVERGLLAQLDGAYLRHAATTLVLAAGATAATVAFGFAAACAAHLAGRRAAGLLAFVAGLGYAVPGTVLALGLLAPLVALDGALSGLLRPLGGPTGLIVMGSLAGVGLAYVLRFLRIALDGLGAGLARLPDGVEGAARGLGAGPLGVTFRIHLPLLRPALVGAALLVFVDCLKELPATLLLRPIGTETLATLVYGAASRGLFEEGALAALTIVAVGIGPVLWLTGAARAYRPAASSRSARRSTLPTLVFGRLSLNSTRRGTL